MAALGALVFLIFVTNVNAFNHISFFNGLARFKRDATEDGSVCLLTCIETMEEQLEAIKSVRTQRTQFQKLPSGMCQRYDSAQLDALCGSHKEAKECLDACPEGEMRNVGVNALTPLNFMCLDRLEDFKKHLPCLDSTCELVEKACQPTCSQYKLSVDKLTEIQRDMNARQSYGAPAVTKIVSDACQFIDCFTGCSHPLIVEKCGLDAADLQRDTVKKAFASVTNLLANLGVAKDGLPDTCQTLAYPFEDDFSLSENATIAIGPSNNAKMTMTAVVNVPKIAYDGEAINDDAKEVDWRGNEALFNSALKIGMSLKLLSISLFLYLGRLL